MTDTATQFLEQLERQHKQADRPRPRPRSRLTNFFDGFQRTQGIQAAASGGFQAGKIDRLTEDFNPKNVGPNAAFRADGKRMRERARDLVLNNPLAKSGVEKFIVNVFDCGLLPKPQLEDPGRRKLWTQAFRRWSGLSTHSTRECDITGDQTICGLDDLWLAEIIVGGGCLLHYVELPRRGRTIPLALELIPEERFADHLQSFGRNPKTAKRVSQGIEWDPATGRALAYHLTPSIPGDDPLGDPFETIRLPAEDCEYAFFKTRAGQRRGHTLLHASIMHLWALGYYTDNELAASDVKSSWAYMIKTDASADFDWDGLNDSSPENGAVDINGNPVEKHERAMVWRGKPGDDITSTGPNVPQSDSLPWIELIQRSIAVGMGQSFEEVTGDYSKGNMASVRMSAASVRKGYRRMQRFAVRHKKNPTWLRFVQHAVRAGLDGFPTPSDFLANDEPWLQTKYSFAGWLSPKPKDDAEADDIRLANGSMTLTEAVESRGGDLEEHLDQLQEEREEKESRGLIFASDAEEVQNRNEDLLSGDREDEEK